MNVLFIRSGGLGDALLTLPVVQAHHIAHPTDSIDVLGNGTMLEAARLTTLFREYHSLDHAGFTFLYGDLPVPGDSIFSRYDCVYAFTTADAIVFRARVLAAGANECHVLDPREPAGWRRHITSHLMTILGNSPDEPPLPEFSERDRSPGKGIVIHPGSGGMSKNWPRYHFIELAGRLPQPVTYLLGPAELERGVFDSLPGNVASGLTLVEVCDLLIGALLYIGNDAGISHLAGMLGTPSLALFGPTDPVIWRPLGRRVRVLSAPGREMERLDVEMVLRAADSI